jgi:hypothetical protein
MPKANGASNMNNNIIEQFKQLKNESSGNKSINYRFTENDRYRGFSVASTKKEVDSTGFFANEYGIPTPGSGLDITFPTSATTLGIASTSTNDTAAGSGARILLITGLDENYDEITDVVALNGQTEVNSVLLFLRVQSVLVIAVGATGYNEGTIYIGGSANSFTAGVPQTDVYRTIGFDTLDNIGINASNGATYTIPRGFEGVPLDFKSATDATDNKPLLVRGVFRPLGLPELSVGNLVFNGSNEFTFNGFPVFAEKTDIILRSRADSTTINLAAIFWDWNIRKTSYELI